MQKRFAETIREMRGLINDWSAPVLLAVSGGIDSMCMADLFAGLEDPVPFAVAHCNFRLRGAESDGDEALVRQWAEERGVRCHVISFDTEAYAGEKGISIEMAARELRYGWFAGLCRESGYRAVCTAHNANDNAETLVLNLLRGSGLKGLSGMSAASPLSFGAVDGVILFRPLLSFTRKQIEGYVFAQGICYREDSTNSSSEYKRNKIRNEVFPIFGKINPSFIRTLNREMGYLCEAEQIVESWASELLPTVAADGRICISRLLAMSHWRYLLYRILEPYGFHSAVIASVEELLTSSRTVPGKRFQADSYELVMGRDEMTVMERPQDVNPEAGLLQEEKILPVRTAGTLHFAGRVIKVETFDRIEGMSLKQPAGTIVMDASKLRFPFVIRAWRHGDWLVPMGMTGKKKVSDLFTDLKYDGRQKSGALMVVDVQTAGLAEMQHVAAVAGVRVDDRYKINVGTRKIIRITVE